jgi:hypothetical protein
LPGPLSSAGQLSALRWRCLTDAVKVIDCVDVRARGNVATFDRGSIAKQYACACVALDLLETRELLVSKHDRMARPVVIDRACTRRSRHEALEQLRRHGRAVAEQHQHPFRRLECSDAAAEGASHPLVPRGAHDRLGAAKLDRFIQQVCVASQHDNDSLEFGY